ncbi:serine/threonine-protein kinase [Streptomyces reniochalinae]|uniref:Serine/threonine protein kinase n=1 Tax=Streptomyces reniochalinae TaxID=2250578 RepID=A0A367EDG7_9ACTN|nr:serine/threonine-protein kinase [Streptomyces reniochalinae]RCG15280.1 serine/threonine protein kinase [Streptomyces reniochalinae]
MAFPLTHDDPVRLGDYRLIARLGSGGMGTVYLGRAPRGRTVALKTMHAEFAAQQEFRTRFQLEVDAARVIGGRHGAEVVDADVLGETPWLATEYVLGPPLDDAVALSGPLPEDATRALGARLCDALAQLHASDVVHRDLKPSNILLSAAGPKVIDFGIARAAGDDRLTRTGAAAGTPAFMSPEQATGAEHTPAGDVFALAGVLVFACTGSAPFGVGQAADLLYRVRYGEPDLSRVPPGLVEVFERCLSKDPSQRPTTRELAEQLGGGVEFADLLPDGVHAEILRRCQAVWDAVPPRLAAPTDGQAERTTCSGVTGSTRRRVLLWGGAGLVAAAAGAGAWATTRPDGTEKPAVSPPSDTAAAGGPDPSWQSPFDEGDLQAVMAGDYVAVASDVRLTVFDMEGKRKGTNKYIQGNKPPHVDGDHLYQVSHKLDFYRVDPKTAEFADRVADLHKVGLRDGNGADVLGVHEGFVVIQDAFDGEFEEPQRRYVGLDARTGKVRWRKTRKTAGVTVIAASDGMMVMVDIDQVFAVDVVTGKTVWSREFDAAVNSELSTAGTDQGGHIYLGLDEVVALRVKDGKTAWRFGKGRKPPEPKKGEKDGYYGTPLYHDGTVYASVPGSGVVALDAKTGKLQWDMEAPWATEIPPHAVPAAGDRYLYFASKGARLITAVDRDKRETKWVVPGKGEEEASLMPHHGSRQLVVATDKRVFGLPLK